MGAELSNLKTNLKVSPFLFGGISASLKSSKKKDLGLILCHSPCLASAVFSKNRYPSPHIIHGRKILPSNNIKAILVNSGQSLAGCGQLGLDTNNLIVKNLSSALKIAEKSILTSSTGVIGKAPDVKKIKTALPKLIKNLSSNCENFAEAILTTDLKTKTAGSEFTVEKQKYSVLGVAKGSGMIAPQMATMLAYIVTDYPFNFGEIEAVTKKIAAASFNCVTIDGDTSTSDSFFLLSSQNKTKSPKNKKLALSNILKVAQSLAKQIAADGEGAKHLIELTVKNAPSKKIANTILQQVLNSPLVKTCIHGADPNWGRLIMALGNALAIHKLKDFTPVNLKIQDCLIFKGSQPVSFNEKKLTQLMKKFEVNLEIDLITGKFNLTGWGCDLSADYVKINADYRT